MIIYNKLPFPPAIPTLHHPSNHPTPEGIWTTPKLPTSFPVLVLVIVALQPPVEIWLRAFLNESTILKAKSSGGGRGIKVDWGKGWEATFFLKLSWET